MVIYEIIGGIAVLTLIALGFVWLREHIRIRQRLD